MKLSTLSRCLACYLPLPLLAISAHAQFQVGDDFNDPARDVTKWGAVDPGTGDSDLVEGSGVLGFLAPVPSFSISSASRVWQGRSVGNTNDWQVTVDAKLATLDLPDSAWASLSLTVSNPGNPDNHVSLSLQQLQFDIESLRQVSLDAATSSEDAVLLSDPFGAASTQLQMNYDANSRMIVAGYKSGGVLKVLGSWNTTFWNMNSGSVFEFKIVASALATAIGAGQLTVDNFSINEKGPRSLAALQGGDDFNDGVRNASNWGAMDSVLHLGQLTETAQALRFSTAGDSGSDHDLAASLWSAGAGDLSKSWSAQVDLSLPTLTLPEGGRARVGLVVLNLADPGDRAVVSLGVEQSEGATVRGFKAEIHKDGLDYGDLDAGVETPSLSAAVRARWDAKTKVLVLEYDADGATGGYNWTLLTQYSLDSGDTRWDLGATGRFQVGVFGESENGVGIPSSAKVQLDNFKLVTESVVIPTLKLAQPVRSGNQLKLSWAGGVGPYQVQSRGLVQSGAWGNVGGTVSGTESVIPMAANQGFVRILDLGQ